KDRPLLVARGDIEKAQLVGASFVVDHRLLDGIPRIAQGNEIHALDDAAILYIETGNDAYFQHAQISSIRTSQIRRQSASYELCRRACRERRFRRNGVTELAPRTQ